MGSGSFVKPLTVLLTTPLLALVMLTLANESARADIPNPRVDAPFTAPTCAGDTVFDPTDNAGFSVTDLTQVFGERLNSFNDGHIVPLYDAFGGSILLEDDGNNTGEAAYPPLCGTRYVSSLGTAVSEWMFCTDREAQTCGDTDASGNLVDEDGNPINPMTGLTTNPKLSSDQEKLIAFLVQRGHSYAGVGSQSWGGVTEARADLGSNERVALQTLVWCISDPGPSPLDFAETCDNNMDSAEQARLLAMIPDVPEVALTLSSSGPALVVGDTAQFTLVTNVFNQPIQIVTGGTATINWAVCSGDATLNSSAVTVNGNDPSLSETVVLCATAATAGMATMSATATPPSLEHIGWSQSVNELLAQACQVYATFHEVDQLSTTANAAASFAAAPAPGPGRLADTGITDSPLLVALALVAVGGGAWLMIMIGYRQRA